MSQPSPWVNFQITLNFLHLRDESVNTCGRVDFYVRTFFAANDLYVIIIDIGINVYFKANWLIILLRTT